jgi:hypothetical protein
MAKREALITDEQWKKLDPLLPVYRQSPKGRTVHKSPYGTLGFFESE